MGKSSIKFLSKLLLFSSPFLLLIMSYFVLDPFSVMRLFPEYGSNYLRFCNRNVLSTSTFLYYNPEFAFKSFVFGSSRSSAFLTKDWKMKISDPSPYHYDAFNDNISGIRSKLDYIKKQENRIENVLIILDSDSFSEKFEDMESLPHLRDPRWEKENKFLNKNWWKFQLTFFKAFFKNYFFVKFYYAKIFKTYQPWLEGAFTKHEGYYFASPNNDFTFPMLVEQIKEDSVNYYKNPIIFKSVKKVRVADPAIKKHHLVELAAISKILREEKTDYRIIIGPTYEWTKYSPVDLEILNIYFDKKRIFNYSGKNEYTEYSGNFYDDSHYKPSVGKAILNEVYD